MAQVRTVGVVDSVRGLVPGGHVCWAYRDRADFQARALEYLTDGIALGQAFARFEYLIDQKMSALPVTALCSYSLAELGRAAIAERACLHPLASASTTPFRLYAEQDVEFIDHRRLLVLRTTRPGVGRIIELLDVEGVRVEPLR